MERRKFIKTAAATAFVMSLGRQFGFAASPGGGMPYRTLGATGEKVSLLGLGGFHIGQSFVSDQLAIQIVRTAIDEGVNFMDNCWDYNGGLSEERMGKALRDGYRAKTFLMTKLDDRTAQGAARQLDQSLQRLQTDRLDLVQIHDVSRMDAPEKVFAPGGAVEALVRAKQAGKVRYIGFTGHKSVAIHNHMLDVADQHGFRFDAVQMPLNVMDAHYSSFGTGVLPRLKKKNIGVLAMKSLGDKSILESNTATPEECLKFTMNLPVSVCITGIDSMEILRQGLGVAKNFQPLSEAKVQEILTKTEVAAADGHYEPYKTVW